MYFRILKIFFIFLISCILAIFFIQLFFFKEKVLSFQKYNNTKSSNIVILTGGTNRIKDGLNIINHFDKSKRTNFKILVSGTGKGFSKNSLIKQIGPNFNPKLVECCIYLDSVSKDTLTNAIETSKWANRNDLKEFILITSNYHMPRAILEFKNVMPNHKIYTFPITPRKHNIKEWMRSYETFSLIFKEFCKYIVSNLRIKLLNSSLWSCTKASNKCRMIEPGITIIAASLTKLRACDNASFKYRNFGLNLSLGIAITSGGCAPRTLCFLAINAVKKAVKKPIK